MNEEAIQIIAFYEFKDLPTVAPLVDLRDRLKQALRDVSVCGTIILANEGFNGMLCGNPDAVSGFISRAEEILVTKLAVKSSFHEKAPFRKVDVKIKPEIVTLKKPVDISSGIGTHVEPGQWNELIDDPETLVLDARNDYEYETGTFKRAINPRVKKFSDLPQFVAENLDPQTHKRVAMFCTGGIRCEKFAPYLKEIGFAEVFQLKGGILKYLEEMEPDDMLWEGECFVFDERISLNKELRKGTGPDLSQRHANAKKPPYEIK